jgi:hypothetical protein
MLEPRGKGRFRQPEEIHNLGQEQPVADGDFSASPLPRRGATPIRCFRSERT